MGRRAARSLVWWGAWSCAPRSRWRHVRPLPSGPTSPRTSASSSAGSRRHPPRHAGRALTVVVSLSEPLDVVDVDGATPRSGRFEAVAGGLTSRSVAIRHDGNQHGIRLSLTPLGARAIFGMPSAALAHDLVQLDDVLGRLGAELVDRMRGAETWPDAFVTLDASWPAGSATGASAPRPGTRSAPRSRRLGADSSSTAAGCRSAPWRPISGGVDGTWVTSSAGDRADAEGGRPHPALRACP